MQVYGSILEGRGRGAVYGLWLREGVRHADTDAGWRLGVRVRVRVRVKVKFRVRVRVRIMIMIMHSLRPGAQRVYQG